MAMESMNEENAVQASVRYSDEELQEFKELILEKLERARKDMESFKSAMNGSSGNDTTDTAPTFKILEEGQEKYIKNREAALIRIENKTYGICRKTGQLIPKERLRSVPHATLSVEAKLEDKKKK